MFKTEGLHITTEGYFYVRWDGENQMYAGKKLNLSDIETHVGSLVILNPGVRLHHVLMPVIQSAVFAVIFKRNFWAEICAEILSSPWSKWAGDTATTPDGDEIEYLEIYEALDYNKQDNELYNLTSRLSFHGIGYPFVSQEKSDEYYSKIGDRTPFSLSMSSMAEYMNHPIRVGKISLEITTPNGYDTVFKDAKMNVSLYSFIEAIFYDMSFHGAKASREAFGEGLTEQIAEIKNTLT